MHLFPPPKVTKIIRLFVQDFPAIIRRWWNLLISWFLCMGGLIFTMYTFTSSSLIDILWLSLNDKLCCIALWWWVGCTFKDQLSPLLTIHSSLNLHLHIFNFATFPKVAGKKLKIMPHLLNEPFFYYRVKILSNSEG